MSAPRLQTLTPKQEAAKLTPKQVAMPWAMYVRVSTVDQGLKYSPASQRATLLQLARDLGVTVPERFILTDAKSGRSDDRPDYQRLMQLAKDKQIGGALVLELSRVGRNVPDSLAFRSMLKKEGVAVAFALQQFDDSPQGKFMWTQFAAVAELEADMILQRTCKGRLQKAKEGTLTDPHTFGYQYHPSTRVGGKFQPGWVEVHPVEGPIVKRMFEEYARHGSSYRIANWLNEAGIVTKRGNMFSIKAALKILRNRMYTGVKVAVIKGEDLKYVEVEIQKPELAIISSALFDKVQVKLAGKKDRSGRPPTQNLLSGFLRCACTLPLGARCTRKWVMNNKWCFACTNKYNRMRPAHDRCPSREVSRVDMERIVINDVRNSLRSPENTYRMAKAFHVASLRDAGKKETVSIETKLARLDAKYARTEATMFADVPQQTRDKAAKILREIEDERRALEVEARETAAEVVTLPTQDSVERTFERMQKGLDGLETFDEKREFLNNTVKHIETDGRTYTIFCRVRLDAASVAKSGKNTTLHHDAAQYFDYLIRGRVA